MAPVGKDSNGDASYLAALQRWPADLHGWVGWQVLDRAVKTGQLGQGRKKWGLRAAWRLGEAAHRLRLTRSWSLAWHCIQGAMDTSS